MLSGLGPTLLSLPRKRSMTHPFVSDSRRGCKATSPSSPLQHSPAWRSYHLAMEPSNYPSEMDYIVDRCTSPTPYSHLPARASDIVLLRFADAVSESLGLQSNSSTTLSCAKPRPSPVTVKGKSLLRILQRFMPCTSSTHHGNLESDMCAKKMGSISDDDMSDKISGEYEEVTLADALIEHTPILRTPLETILEHEEEYL